MKDLPYFTTFKTSSKEIQSSTSQGCQNYTLDHPLVWILVDPTKSLFAIKNITLLAISIFDPATIFLELLSMPNKESFAAAR